MTGIVEVDARARDLVTRASDDSLAHDQRLRLTLGADRSIQVVEAGPPEPRLADLVGATVGPGFRSRLATVLPDHAEDRTLLHTLLDDLPGALLVSGYAIQRSPSAPTSFASAADGAFAKHILAQEDMCSGWAAEATIMVTFRSTGSVPTPMGPEAPELERADDPLSWHPMAALPPESTRRRRRLDLLPPTVDQPTWGFDTHFRDSYCDPEGMETAVHEYLVEGSLDSAGRRIEAVRAEARVLPWVECPAALGSAERMTGRALADLRREVRNEFSGTSTCTHLNDSFRMLADLLPLVDLAGET
jgi:hypothetical protein